MADDNLETSSGFEHHIVIGSGHDKRSFLSSDELRAALQDPKVRALIAKENALRVSPDGRISVVGQTTVDGHTTTHEMSILFSDPTQPDFAQAALEENLNISPEEARAAVNAGRLAHMMDAEYMEREGEGRAGGTAGPSNDPAGISPGFQPPPNPSLFQQPLHQYGQQPPANPTLNDSSTSPGIQLPPTDPTSEPQRKHAPSSSPKIQGNAQNLPHFIESGTAPQNPLADAQHPLANIADPGNFINLRHDVATAEFKSPGGPGGPGGPGKSGAIILS